MKSIVLVGELNPYGNDPEYALYPHPPNSADRAREVVRLTRGMS